MTQYNTKQGLNRFGKSGVSAIKKEVRHMVKMDALDPEDLEDLRRYDYRAAMAYLMLLKKKRDGAIKAQGCCDRRMQRNYMTKEETSPPTFTQEILIITYILDSMERHDMDVANIPGAFIQMDMVHGNRIVRIRLCGVLVDILVNIDPETLQKKLS